MNNWIVIATAAGIVAIAASAVAIATLATVVKRWDMKEAKRKASQEPIQGGGVHPTYGVERLSERLRAMARDLEIEAHKVAVASEEHEVTPPRSRRNG